MHTQESTPKRKRVTPFRNRGDLKRFAEKHGMTSAAVRRRWKNNDANIIRNIRIFLELQEISIKKAIQTKQELLAQAPNTHQTSQKG